MAYKHVIRAKTKNLFNVNNADVTYYDGYWRSNVSYTGNFYTLTVEPEKTYTVRLDAFSPLDKSDGLCLSVQTGTHFLDGNLIIELIGEESTQHWYSHTRTFTVPAGFTLVTLSTLVGVRFRNLQITEGSIPTPYTPYNYLQSNKRMIKVSEVCQLLDKSKYDPTYTYAGITWTNNGDGTITANGSVVSSTPYSAYSIYIPQFKEVKNNHKYALFSGIDNINVAYVECIFWLGNSDSYFYQDCVETNRAGTFGFTIPQGEYLLYQKVELRVRPGYTANNLIYKPQLFDLTEMFGAGHEPATVAEFRQRFPNELYPYSPQCWLTSYKSAVVCKTKNLFDVNNAVPYTFSTDNPDGNLIWLKDGIYTTRMNNYNIGSGLRIKNGLSLPAGTYTVSAKIVDFNNVEKFVIGFRYKTTDGTWKVPAYSYENYKVGNRIALRVILPKNTDVRLYLTYQNNNGVYLTGFVSYKDIQLEQGSTETSYVPYQHL